MAYDPVPDLAQLIDGLREFAVSGGSGPGILGGLYTGPYARLRGGLLLDEPGWEDPLPTSDAIYTALRELPRGVVRK